MTPRSAVGMRSLPRGNPGQDVPRSLTVAARLVLLLLLLLLLSPIMAFWTGPAAPPSPPAGHDWPMARFDAARSAASPQELTLPLHLQWVREYPPLRPAWPDQPKMQFDAAYDPVVSGQTLYVGSSGTDSVTALDTATGNEKWRFVADGPVRFAPLCWEGRVYFVADDGYLYCLDAAGGGLLWKFRGGPSDRKILGNERLISSWPARGAPVIADGTLYFAASIWPFMGVFIHALDARTGEVVWTNDGDGCTYMKQPHNADSFAGVAPQGPLVVAGDRLLIPGGRSVPACYDRRTGKLLHYRLADNAKTGGGSEVSAGGNVFLNGGVAFDLETGDSLGAAGDQVVAADNVLFAAGAAGVQALDLKAAVPVETPDRKGNPVRRIPWPLPQLATAELPRLTDLVQAGSRLFAATESEVLAIDLPLETGKPAVAWRAPVEGKPVRLLAADNRLFAVTLQGRIYCFGTKEAEPRVHRWSLAPTAPADAWTGRAQEILSRTGVHDGYCVAWGVGTGRLVTELARQSRLHIIVIDPDAGKVDAFRRELIAADLYGDRVTVLAGEPLSFPLPPYLAALMVAEDLPAAGLDAGPDFFRKAFFTLRPYGGVAWLPVAAERRGFAVQEALALHLPGAAVQETPDGILLAREGALPESANWTHEHADAANTRVSKDRLVKAPLGVLWFGGPSNDGVLPRHGHGPQPQVIDGRAIVEGVDMMRAVDIYTGRLLWQIDLPGVGKVYNNTVHQAGANGRGSNYVSTSDGIYVAYGKTCLRLDPATGQRLSEFRFPTPAGGDALLHWDFVSVSGDYLVGGADPGPAEVNTDETPSDPSGNTDRSSSRYLAVLERYGGKVLWSTASQSGFRHNALCIGNGRVYAIDRLAGEQTAALKRRGETPNVKARLAAYDLRTGKEIWSTDSDVFGTWLSYSVERDVLVETGRMTRDTLSDEPRGMRAFRGGNGELLWDNKNYSGPGMIHGDMLLHDQSACDLLTGAPRLRPDPLTGQMEEWQWWRGYGCNTPAASENLLTFRSGAAGFFDLCGDGGTGNLGGFRSSCTNNLIVAGGVLTAPDYTRTCTCSYQNQTSVALVHVPEVEMWTYFGPTEIKGTIRRVGINLGAAGDHKADDGTMWLEYPSTGGLSPAVPVSHTGTPEWFRRHSSQVQGAGPPWVAGSGARGLTSLTVALGKETDAERTYTVRLHFLEPDRVQPGERRFDVALQDEEVLHDFDVVKEAGGRLRSLVKEFKGVKVRKDLRVTLTPSPEAPVNTTILCGVEMVAEGW
jgi:outer membrane protein assembly factor BamB